MKLLIVDDEQIALEGLKHIINWEAYGIDKLFMTYNIIHAKEIIIQENIILTSCKLNTKIIQL